MPTEQNGPASASGPCSRSSSDELSVLQDKLEAISRSLEHSNRLAVLGTHAAAIAHEISNILTPATNYIELANADPDDPHKTRRALEHCSQAMNRASQISMSILDLATSKDSMFHVEPPSTDSCVIGAALEQALCCLLKRPANQGIDLQVDIEPDACAAIPMVTMQQILLNLLLNAMQALPQGGTIRVSAYTYAPTHGPDRASIRIADNGVGMAQEDLARVFQPFVSLQGGHGLGLMVCQLLVERAGGTISVQSEPGKGTTFVIDLPEARQAWRKSA